MMRSSFWIVVMYVIFSSARSVVGAGLRDILGLENQNQRQGRGLQQNHNILQLLNGNNKPYNPRPNNNYNQRPYPTRPNTQGQSNREQLESLKERLEKLNQALDEKNKKNDKDNPDNDNNDNITVKPIPKPSKNNNTNGKNNDNTNGKNNDITHSNNNGNAVITKTNWKKFTRSKLFFQAQPVVPEDEQQALNQTVYYQN